MQLTLSETQSMLQDTANRLLRDRHSFEQRKKILAGQSESLWNAFAELGLLGIEISEDCGGAAGSFADLAVVLEAMGRHLVVEPFLSTVVLGAGLIAESATGEARASLQRAIAEGRLKVALAHGEPRARYVLSQVETRARRADRGFIIDGAKSMALGANDADQLIVSARTSGHRHDRSGVSLFVVDRRAANLHLQSFKTIDGRRAAEVSLRDVKGQLLGKEGEGVAALEACRDRAIGALCAEAVGAMGELNAATLEYSKTRKQFGATIGSFQVLQHRMVDMFIAHQEAFSLMHHLNLSLSASEAGVSRLASGAKSKIGYAGKFVADQAVQLHGGMGMTDELNVGHYFKRISSINIQFGDPAYHVLRYAQLDAAA